MTQAIIPFNFDDHLVRVVERSGEPWWIATDIAKVLGYRESERMTRFLDDDEKGPHNVGTLGGEQTMTVINESGLYSAILRSRRDEARRFRKWVTAEVLPQLRKTGAYGRPAVSPDKQARQLLTLDRLMTSLIKTDNAAQRQTLYTGVTRICDELDLPTPPLEQLGRAAPNHSQRLKAFWDTVLPLIDRGRIVNHHRKASLGLLALNLKEVQNALDAAKSHLPPLHSFKNVLRYSTDPAFVAIGTINGRSGRHLHCWVFIFRHHTTSV